MSDFLFDEFASVSAAAWKQKVQVELKGLDYKDTLLHMTEEGIVVKPFYTDEDRSYIKVPIFEKQFNICQTLHIRDEKITNSLALDALQRGANAIQFIADKKFDYKELLKEINFNTVIIYFKFQFLNSDFITELSNFTTPNNPFFQIDIIGNLAGSSNWFVNRKEDFLKLENIAKHTENSIAVDLSLYQNAGANSVQQLAYTLAHANEYLHYFSGEIANHIHFIFSVGGHYFFEIAKIRAFRALWDTLTTAYHTENTMPHIFTQPGIRNKTLYDYNVNMLRTTSECISAILGSSDTISNLTYDSLYRKSNEFGEHISRNQLLILQQESYLATAQNFAEGSYYIDYITNQLAEKSLVLFKQIEKSGGFLKLLKKGTIQKKIAESAAKEQQRFHAKKRVLLGSNLLPNRADTMKKNMEIDPFSKKKHLKTLLSPIVIRRLSEPYEIDRLNKEE